MYNYYHAWIYLTGLIIGSFMVKIESKLVELIPIVIGAFLFSFLASKSRLKEREIYDSEK